MIKLHLGCGARYLKGYIHIDLADYSHINHKHNIKYLPMFKDDSVDLIYSSHALGYFDRIEVIEVLKEWHRVLKLGRLLRLALPNFAALAKVYLKYKNLDLIIGPLYGRWPNPRNNLVLYQKTIFDFNSLVDLLKSIGFKNIAYWNWREVFVGELTGFDDYSQAYIPHMHKDDGLLISLNVEARK